jgi:hypothetical protein
VFAISAAEEPPVYERGVTRSIFICHTLGYFRPGSICDDGPGVDERRQMYKDIERDLCTLVMEHGGIILSLYDDEPDDPEEDEFVEFSLIECEFPNEWDGVAATHCVLDMWADFGVSVFYENGEIITGRETVSSPNAAKTNKSPQKRVPARLVKAYARLSDEKDDVLSNLRRRSETGDESTIEECEPLIDEWCKKRDLIYSFARSRWLEVGLSSEPTAEQIDAWLGGNNLHSVCQ